MSTVVPNPRRWWALAVIALAQFLVIMDTSIIGVALPEIQRALDFSQSDLSWVFNAYVIAFGGLLLLGGKLSDLYGARRLFIAGFAILTGASLLTGLAQSSEVLLVGRALQGLGSALIAPAALTLLMTLFGHDPKELTKALALYGAAAPAGGTAGVFLGGVLTEWVDWRWVFLINIPVGLAVLAVSTTLLPALAARRGSVDIAGALSVTAALSLAVYAIVRAPEAGWGSTETVLELLLAGGLLALFATIQARRQEPLMPLSILRAPNLAAANVAMALLGAAWVPMWFFLNLYLQQVLGFGAFEGGAALLPMTITIMVLMVGVTAKVIGRYGFKPTIVAGMVILAAGTGLLSLVRADGNFAVDVLPATLIAALGMSLAYIPAMLAALSGAKPEQGGLASGIVNTTYQIGSALGLAVMTAIATGRGADQIGNLPALVDGFSAAFIGAAVVALAGAGLTVVWLRQPRAVSEPTQLPRREDAAERQAA
ncbi:MAG: MFS transporter [Chloroflexota bacterium]|nr:MFS transporter [Chloroflexota bacterium]